MGGGQPGPEIKPSFEMKIAAALNGNPFVSGATKAFLIELGVEMDRLGAEVALLKAVQNPRI